MNKRDTRRKQEGRAAKAHRALTRKAEVADLRHRKNTELAVEVCTRLWPAIQREITRQLAAAQTDVDVVDYNPLVENNLPEDAPSCIVRP